MRSTACISNQRGASAVDVVCAVSHGVLRSVRGQVGQVGWPVMEKGAHIRGNGILSRAAVPLLLVTITLSLAWTTGTFSFFPFMLPLLLLFFGNRYRLDLVAFAFLLVAAVATASAALTGASFGYAMLWTGLAGLYLVTRHRLPDVASERFIARALASVVVVVCLIAIYQFATSTTLGSPYGIYSESMRLGFVAAGDTLIKRPVGLFHNSNILGQWLVFSTLLLLPLLRVMSRRWRFAVGLVVAAVLAITFSRVVWGVAVIAGAALLLRWTFRHPLRVAALCIGTSLVGLYLLFFGAPELPTGVVPDRFGIDATEGNLAERQALTGDAIAVVSEHPLAGVGYLQYVGDTFAGVENLRPHNVFIQVAAEQGIFTAAALGLAVWVVALTCWRSALLHRGDVWLGGALASLPVAWLAFMLVYSSAADYAVMPVFVTALGYLLALADESGPKPQAWLDSDASRVDPRRPGRPDRLVER